MVARRDIIAFLQNHREELVILRDLLAEEDADDDRTAIDRRIACVDELLREKGVVIATTSLH
jgi:hypothetical protein